MKLRTHLKRTALVAAIAGCTGFCTTIANATTYTWNPISLVTANWDNSTTNGWNASGAYPGSAGDLTLSAAENDVADMNSMAYVNSVAIHMNNKNVFLSELDLGSTSTAGTAPSWTIDALANASTGAVAGGSITFKALSGTAVLKSNTARSGKTETIKVPVVFASNTNVIITPTVGVTTYIEIPGTVSGAGDITVSTPGTTSGGVFALEGDVSGYTGTLNFDSTGTVSTGNDRIGLLTSSVNAHAMSVNLSGSSALGAVGISTIELGALNGTGGNIHPYLDSVAATLKVGYKNNVTDTFNGVLSGSVAGKVMSFEKAGTGTQILGGVNTYAGTTTVSGGTLKISSSGSINSTTLINVLSGANFDVSDFSGGGGYTLPTSATLKGAGTVTGSIIVGTNTIAPGDSGAGTLHISSGNLTLSGGAALNFDLSNTAGGSNDHITGITNLTLNGTSTINFNAPAGVGPGHYQLFNYTGALTGGVGNLNFTGLTAAGRQTFALSTTAVANAVTLEVGGAVGNLTWVGGNISGPNNWDNNVTVNWTGETDNHFFNGDNVTFTNTASSFTPNLASNVQPGNVTFTNTTNAYTVGGTGDLIATGNFTVGTGNVTIANSGTFGVTGTVTVNGTLNVNVGNDFTLAGTLTGSGTLHKQGGNTGTLSGSNSGFTGSIFVDSGTLKAGSANALGANNVVTTVANGATLDVNGQNLVGTIVTAEGTGTSGTGGLISTATTGFHHIYGLNLSNDLTITTGPSIFAIDAINTGAGFSPPGAFLHGGGKNLTLNIGGGTVNGGEVDWVGIGDTNLNNISIAGGGTLYVYDNTTLGPTGSVTLQNFGRISFVIPTVINSKPIVVDSSATIADVSTYSGDTTLGSPINILGTQLQATVRPTVAGTNTLTFTSQLTGPGGLIVHDVGNAAVSFLGVVALTSSANDYAGPTVIGGGSTLNGAGGGLYTIVAARDAITLSVGNGGTTGALGTGNVTINSGAKLRFNRSNTFPVNNKISGAGNVEQNGAGTTILSGMNTYTGPTTVNTGTLQFAKPASFYNAITANWTSANVYVASGAVAAFNVGGASEFQATDLDTIQTQINGASLPSSGFEPGSSIGLDTTGGNFSYSTAITDANGNSIGLVKSGTNTLTLSGTNTYTGNTTVSAGTLNITGSHTTGANYSVANGANLITNNVLVTNGLTVNGSATINANGGAAGTSKVTTLTMGPSGVLNLKNNDLVVGTGDLLTVRSLIKAGISGTSNTAAPTGITSDMMTVGKHGFGYAQGNDTNLSPALAGSLSGQTFGASSVLVKYTYLGDADLDGDVDVNDFSLWASNFTGSLNPASPPTKFWTQGDFDYDGDVDVNDFSLWASNFTGSLTIGGPGSLIVNGASLNVSSGVISTLEGLGVTVVPEPSTIGLFGLGLGAIGFYGLRKKRTKAL